MINITNNYTENYSKLGNFVDGFASVIRSYGLSGFIDKTGEEKIPCQFSSVHNFSEGLALVLCSDRSYRFINQKGEYAFDNSFYFARDFSEGLAAVMNENGLYGYIDKYGKIVVPYRYTMAGQFKNGLALVVNEKGEHNFINKDGKIAFRLPYPYADSFSEGLAFVQNDKNKMGCINTLGDEVVPCIYDYCEPFSEGMARVGIICGDVFSIYGYIDKRGNEVVPLVYDSNYNWSNKYSNGLVLVRAVREETEKIINKKGDAVFYLPNYLKYQHNDRYDYGRDDHYIEPVYSESIKKDYESYYDENGVLVLPYNFIFPFSEGFAVVENIDGKCGYIDTYGNEVIPCKFDYAHDFSNGFALVSNNKGSDKEYFYIDKSGRKVIEPKVSYNVKLSVNSNDKNIPVDPSNQKLVRDAQLRYLYEKREELLNQMNVDFEDTSLTLNRK